MLGELDRARPMDHVSGVVERDAPEVGERSESLVFIGEVNAPRASGDEEDRTANARRELGEELREEGHRRGRSVEWVGAPRDLVAAVVSGADHVTEVLV